MVWTLGVRRSLAPLHPASVSVLWALAVAFPLLGTLGDVLSLPRPPAPLELLRVERWLEAVAAIGPPARGLALTLLAGTTVIFLVQELGPALSWRRADRPTTEDPRLERSRERVEAALRAAKLIPRRLGVPRVVAD